MGRRSVTDKVVALVLPISAFVAARFEHSVASMHFIPPGIMAASMGHLPAGFDASSLTLAGAIHNLIPVTLGNIVGGSVLVGFVYYAIYHKTRGDPAAAKRTAQPEGCWKGQCVPFVRLW
jgi:formate/nitrite transporter FocA (FNT family)